MAFVSRNMRVPILILSLSLALIAGFVHAVCRGDGAKQGVLDLHTQLENPKMDPGLVRWRRDLWTAREASFDSGKPVLLFQLLGNLDERFL